MELEARVAERAHEGGASAPRLSRRSCVGLAAATFAGAALSPLPTLAAGEEWVAVRDVSLEIVEGSALDFSDLFPPEAAGDRGRVVTSPSGHLAFASEPTKPQRFLCASLAWSPASGSFPDKHEAEIYARQLRLHGYNLARFHFVDAILMSGRLADFDYDPVQFDRFQFLLAALKRNGIYWMIDVMTSPNGAVGGVLPHRWEAKHDLKLRLHIDEAARDHWLRLARTILGKVNPYTGLSPLGDPALALLVLANENGIEFEAILEEERTRRAYPVSLQPAFNAWLRTEYGTTQALAGAWRTLQPDEILEDCTVRLPDDRHHTGPRMRDTQRFFLAKEAETFAWMTGAIRALGYEGLVSGYNNHSVVAAHLSRGMLPVVTANAYFDEVLSFEPGTGITQASSLDDDLQYVRELMAMRWHGRPFVVSEYEHLFWNKHRYESGLVVSAYAALQEWDALCRHAHGAIDLSFRQPWPHKQRIMPYGAGLDPVARAAETLSALLFRRADVGGARGRVLVALDATSITDDAQAQLPSDVTRLGLITGIGLVSGSEEQTARTESQTGAHRISVQTGAIQPASGSLFGRWLNRVVDALSSQDDAHFAARLASLHKDGLLAAEVAVGASDRIYQTDTGQIRVEGARRYAQVVTDRTEAATYEHIEEPRRLGTLTVLSANAPALVAVSSLDGEPITASRRLLIIFATDAQNTEMLFRDDAHRVIQDFGHMPVRIRRGKVALSLQTDAGGAWRLTSLHLNGAPGDVTTLTTGPDGLKVRLDNVASHGPTTFFSLERE